MLLSSHHAGGYKQGPSQRRGGQHDRPGVDHQLAVDALPVMLGRVGDGETSTTVAAMASAISRGAPWARVLRPDLRLGTKLWSDVFVLRPNAYPLAGLLDGMPLDFSHDASGDGVEWPLTVAALLSLAAYSVEVIADTDSVVVELLIWTTWLAFALGVWWAFVWPRRGESMPMVSP